MTSAMFHILLALADESRHGLGVVAETERRTNGKLKLGPGILYGSINKLVAEELIEESAKRPPKDQDDPRRRYYRITRAGRRALQEEAARLEHIVGVAREKRVLTGS